jgi:hypothetical protein
VSRKTDVTQLKRRHGRRLLQLPGVSGVGVERADGGGDDYVLVVHVEQDDVPTRESVKQVVGGEPVRIVKSGRFKKQ